MYCSGYKIFIRDQHPNGKGDRVALGRGRGRESLVKVVGSSEENPAFQSVPLPSKVAMGLDLLLLSLHVDCSRQGMALNEVALSRCG